MGPLGRERPTCKAFYISVNISLTAFLSEFPVREPPTCSLTGSPRTRILRHQSHWPSKGILFIHSFMYVCQSPQKEALLNTYRKNTRSLSTEPNTDRRPKIQWGVAWFPKGII